LKKYQQICVGNLEMYQFSILTNSSIQSYNSSITAEYQTADRSFSTRNCTFKRNYRWSFKIGCTICSDVTFHPIVFFSPCEKLQILSGSSISVLYLAFSSQDRLPNLLTCQYANTSFALAECIIVRYYSTFRHQCA
jgi:hypothetical protein